MDLNPPVGTYMNLLHNYDMKKPSSTVTTKGQNCLFNK